MWMRLIALGAVARALLAPRSLRGGSPVRRFGFLESWGRLESRPSAAAAAAELLGIVSDAYARNARPDAARCSPLVDALVEAGGGAPFDAAAALGGGLWLTLFERGPAPRWRETADALGPLVRNRVGQEYDAGAGRVRNYAEILGPSLAFG